MADLVNPTVITPSGGMGMPMMMGAGYNSGGGILGGGSDGIGALLIGALLFGGGLGGFGNRNAFATGLDGQAVTTAHLQSALNQQTQNQNTNTILQNLAAIQQEIPNSECRVQLGIAAAQTALQNQGAQGQLASANGFAQVQLQAANNATLLQNDILDAQNDVNKSIAQNALNNANSFAATQMAIAGSTAATNQIVRETKDVVESGFAAGQLALANVHSSTLQNFAASQLQAANNAAALMTAVTNDGDRTRSLIQSINETNLNRIITTQANEIIELKNDRHITSRSRETEINVTNTMSQNQAQAQQQQQQQQQFEILSRISAALAGLTQIAHATNQNVIAGNSGPVTTGPQSANPVNVA